MAEETKIRFFRGNHASLTTGLAGQPRWATDAARLYMSTGAALNKIGPGAVASGGTLPTVNLTAGDLFLHNPTGRTYLMQYDGSTWRPILSYGSTTVYVNGASGSDTQNKGFGTGSDAYATIQYAIDQIPPSIGGNVTVNIAAGTYAATVVVAGKRGTGDYSITLQGALNTYESGTTVDTGSVAGSGSTQGTVVCAAATFTANEIQNKLIRFTDATTTVALRGVIRLVDSNTTTTATIVGYWPAAPVNGDTFDVLDWGANAVVIAPASGTAVTVKNGATTVYLDSLYMNPADNNSAFHVSDWSLAIFERCRTANGGTVFLGCNVTFGNYADGDPCLLEYDLGNIYGDRILYVQRSQANVFWCKILGTGTLDFGYVYGVHSDNGSFVYIDLGTVIEGQVTGGSPSNGVYLSQNSTCIIGDGATSDPRIRTWDRGVRAETSSAGQTYNVSYTGNTTNESADAGSFGYIA